MRQKCYIILGVTENNTFIGYTEHSFSMGVDSKTRVRVWRPDLHSRWTRRTIEEYVAYLQKDVIRLNKDHPKIRWSLYSVGSVNCPVKINWSEYHTSRKNKTLDKVGYRNLGFEKKIK